MKPATDVFKSAMLDMFDEYSKRADLNEQKAAAWDYLVDKGWLTGRKIAEAREFARLKEDQ